MVDCAFGIDIDFAYFACAFGDDSLGGVLAGLVFRPVELVLIFLLVLLDFDVFVWGNDRAIFGWFNRSRC